MADVLTAEEVGRLLTLVAPGYFAQVSYTSRYPRTERGELPTLVMSAALSLPIVALAGAIAPGDPKPLDLGYVALLLGLAIVLGYAFALLRGWSLTRDVLSKIGYRREPEASVLSRVFGSLPRKHLVTVTFKDGRKVSGSRRLWTGDPDPQKRGDLYLVYPSWWDPVKKDWLPRQKTDGVIVNVDEVLAIDVRPSPQ